METPSIKKLSILGLVLMAASAVTAAILPSRTSDTGKFAANGSLTDSNPIPALGGHVTCTPTQNIDPNFACNDTPTAGPNSGTTGGGIGNGTSERTSGLDPE